MRHPEFNELHHDLKQHEFGALLYNSVFCLRRLLTLVIVYLMSDAIIGMAAFSLLNLLALCYGLYYRPFREWNRNVLESLNDLVLYALSFISLCFSVAEPHLTPSGFSEIGWYMNLIVVASLTINVIFLIYGIFTPYRDAMNSARSTKLGRFLRWLFDVKLPAK